jgi:hypothetical protein
VIYDEIRKRHGNFVMDQRISCSDGRGFKTILVSLMLLLLPPLSPKTLDTHYLIIIGLIRCMRSWRILRGIKFGNWLTLPQGVTRLGQNGCGRTKRRER